MLINPSFTTTSTLALMTPHRTSSPQISVSPSAAPNQTAVHARDTSASLVQKTSVAHRSAIPQVPNKTSSTDSSSPHKRRSPPFVACITDVHPLAPVESRAVHTPAEEAHGATRLHRDPVPTRARIPAHTHGITSSRM